MCILVLIIVIGVAAASLCCHTWQRLAVTFHLNKSLQWSGTQPGSDPLLGNGKWCVHYVEILNMDITARPWGVLIANVEIFTISRHIQTLSTNQLLSPHAHTEFVSCNASPQIDLLLPHSIHRQRDSGCWEKRIPIHWLSVIVRLQCTAMFYPFKMPEKRDSLTCRCCERKAKPRY